MSENGPIIRNKATGKVTRGKPANSVGTLREGSRPAAAAITSDTTAESLPRRSAEEIPEVPGRDASLKDAAPDRKKPSADSQAKTNPPIETLEQFLAYAYSRQGKRIALKPKVEEAIALGPQLSDEARSRLMALAKGDVLLAVPCQLLLTVREIRGHPKLRDEILSFVRSVLEAHLTFIAPVLSNPLNSPESESALAHLVEADLAREEALKPRELIELRANAAYCVGLWFVEKRSWSPEQLSQFLYAKFWKRQIPESEDGAHRFRALTEIRDLAGLGLACSAFEKQADQQERVAKTANLARDSALERVTTLEASVEQLRQRLAERDQQLAELDQTLSLERERHAHTRAHLRDDIEQLRTRVVRRLKAETHLLTEGLQALRRDPPKVHVMDDHAERALGALQRELKELESED